MNNLLLLCTLFGVLLAASQSKEAYSYDPCNNVNPDCVKICKYRGGLLCHLKCTVTCTSKIVLKRGMELKNNYTEESGTGSGEGVELEQYGATS